MVDAKIRKNVSEDPRNRTKTGYTTYNTHGASWCRRHRTETHLRSQATLRAAVFSCSVECPGRSSVYRSGALVER